MQNVNSIFFSSVLFIWWFSNKSGFQAEIRITKSMERLHIIFSAIIVVLQIIITNSNLLSTGNAKFAQEFYNVLSASQKNNTNFVYSPFSLSACLGLLAIGANGDTLTEIQNVMHFPKEESDLLEGFKKLRSLLQNKSSSTIFNLASGLFPNIGFDLRQEYLAKSRTTFQAKLQQLNYTDSETSAKTINNFVEQVTNHAIKEIVSSSDLTSETALNLINALYFKSAWKYKFSTRKITLPFYLPSNEDIEIDMMFNEEINIPYADIKELDAQVVALPYKDEKFSMLLILPNQKDGITDLEEKLHLVDLGQLHTRLIQANVLVLIPKFKIDSTIDLKNPLQAAGLNLVFDESKSDLSGLSSKSSYVTKIIQKVFIKVDETGAEAAAATRANLVSRSGVDHQTFIADHPFISVIQYSHHGISNFPTLPTANVNGSNLDNVTQLNSADINTYDSKLMSKEAATILFIGRIVNPTME